MENKTYKFKNGKCINRIKEKNNTNSYSKNGYLYVRNRITCGICCGDIGESQKKEGELSYDGCEEDSY